MSSSPKPVPQLNNVFLNGPICNAQSSPVAGAGSDSDWLNAELWLTLQQHHQQWRSRWKQAASPSRGPEAQPQPSEPVVRGAEPGEGGAGPRQQILPGQG